MPSLWLSFCNELWDSLRCLCWQRAASTTPSFSVQGLGPCVPAWAQPDTHRHVGPLLHPSALRSVIGDGGKTPCLGTQRGCWVRGRRDPLQCDCPYTAVLRAGRGQPARSTLHAYGDPLNQSPVLCVHAACVCQGDPGTKSMQSWWVKGAQQTLLSHQMGQNYHWDTSSAELFEGKAILSPEILRSDQRCNRRGKAHEAQPIQLLMWKLVYWLNTALMYLHL